MRNSFITVSGISIIRGNPDGDQTVSLSDAVTTLGYLFEGKSPPCAAAADFDADGEVAIDDAISTLWFLFLGGDAPASPFPNCGMVPESALGCEQEACK